MMKDRHADFETYIHRIGRTGRFGKSGVAINFVSDRHDEKIINKVNLKLMNKLSNFNLNKTQIGEHFCCSIPVLDAGDYDDLEDKLAEK